MDWINNLSDITSLITGLLGLISAGVGAYFAIKNFIALNKEKNKNEIWAMIMSVADSAMQEAERTGKAGADKKAMVIEIVKSSCIAAGLDITDFLEQLNDYIDSTISFVNKMTKNSN